MLESDITVISENGDIPKRAVRAFLPGTPFFKVGDIKRHTLGGMAEMIRILIADDHELFRKGLARLLEDEESFEVVGDAENGERAVELCRDAKPHVVLMDLSMPGIGGLEATRRIIRLDGDIRVVVLTARREEPYPSQALKAGASGYVTKTSGIPELVTGVRRAAGGQRFVSADVAQQLALRSFEDTMPCPFDLLSSREMQITLMVVNCQRVQDISEHLHLSPKTVNSYRYRIFEKLNVSSDVELALLAVRHGMVAIGGPSMAAPNIEVVSNPPSAGAPAGPLAAPERGRSGAEKAGASAAGSA